MSKDKENLVSGGKKTGEKTGENAEGKLAPTATSRYTMRRRLVSWGGWFFLFNAILLCAVGSQYLSYYPWPEQLIGQFYAVAAYVAHFALISWLPWLFVLLPLSLLVPRPRIIVPLSIFVSSCLATAILLDSLVFAENHFHINALMVAILGWETWGFGLVYFVIFFALLSFVAKLSWKRFGRKRSGYWGVVCGGVIVVFFLSSQALHVWADASYFLPITQMRQYLPFYYPVTAKKFLHRHQLVNLTLNRERKLLGRLKRQQTISDKESNLQYPLRPLQCELPANKFNILVILVDALRQDVVGETVTPNLSGFAKRASAFVEHSSAGNSSRPGLFSLFYGLPSTYWQTFETVGRSPVLIDRIQELDYEIAIFSSASLYRPASLDRTTFSKVPNLRLETKSANNRGHEKDRIITGEWLDWIEKRKSDQKFFGFLYYDSPTSMDFPPDYSPLFPVEPSQYALQPEDQRQRFAIYKTAIHFVDSLIGTVLDDLDRRGLLEQTVVVVTSDHGQEFDERGMGFKGHGSAFSDFQLQVPLIVHWPKTAWPERSGVRVTERSSHNDIVPTLMSEVLGCQGSPEDYSSGSGLYAEKRWELLVAGSYFNFAVIEPQQVTISYPNGQFEVRDQSYAIIDNPQVNKELVSKALVEMNRFYKR